LHGTEDGKPALRLNPRANPSRASIEHGIVLHNLRLTSENALEIIGQYDIVVDGTDNFPARYLTNDACSSEKRTSMGPFSDSEGQASVFAPHLEGLVTAAFIRSREWCLVTPKAALGFCLGLLDASRRRNSEAGAGQGRF
jgi:adenylyltransferase/sulfurtransferase